jgi:hypothetical protein
LKYELHRVGLGLCLLHKRFNMAVKGMLPQFIIQLCVGTLFIPSILLIVCMGMLLKAKHCQYKYVWEHS